MDNSPLTIIKVYNGLKHRILEMPKDENYPLNKTKLTAFMNAYLANDNTKLMQAMAAGITETRYVSWKEFFDNTKKNFDKFLEIVNDTKTEYYFDVLWRPSKSNYWMLQLFLKYCRDNENISFGVDTENQCIRINTNTYKLTNQLGPRHGNDKNIIIIDDASYSGTQVVDEIKTFSRNKVYVVIPYISKKAHTRISKLIDEDQILFTEQFDNTLWSHYKTKKQDEFKHISEDEIPRQLRNVKQELNRVHRQRGHISFKKGHTIPLAGEYEKDDYDEGAEYVLNPRNYTIYFDHKIADAESAFPEIYQLGQVPTKHPKLEYEYKPFIENCYKEGVEMLPGYEREEAGEELCVPSFYKTVQAKYTLSELHQPTFNEEDQTEMSTVHELFIDCANANSNNLPALAEFTSLISLIIYNQTEKTPLQITTNLTLPNLKRVKFENVPYVKIDLGAFDACFLLHTLEFNKVFKVIVTNSNKRTLSLGRNGTTADDADDDDAVMEYDDDDDYIQHKCLKHSKLPVINHSNTIIQMEHPNHAHTNNGNFREKYLKYKTMYLSVKHFANNNVH